MNWGLAPYNLIEFFDVSEEAAASIFNEEFFCFKAIGSGFLHIVIKFLPDYTASRPVSRLIRGTNELINRK